MTHDIIFLKPSKSDNLGIAYGQNISTLAKTLDNTILPYITGIIPLFTKQRGNKINYFTDTT